MTRSGLPRIEAIAFTRVPHNEQSRRLVGIARGLGRLIVAPEGEYGDARRNGEVDEWGEDKPLPPRRGKVRMGVIYSHHFQLEFALVFE